MFFYYQENMSKRGNQSQLDMEFSPDPLRTRVINPNRGWGFPTKTGTEYGARDPYYAKNRDGFGAGYTNPKPSRPYFDDIKSTKHELICIRPSLTDSIYQFMLLITRVHQSSLRSTVHIPNRRLSF